MIHHLLFDLDGTLSDSREGIRNSVAHALRRLGLPPPPPETIEAWIGPPLQDSFAAYLRTLEPGRIDEALRLFREYYAARGVRQCAAYPGVPEALATLCARGHDLYVATAKPTDYAREVLRHLGIDAAFRGASGPAAGSRPILPGRPVDDQGRSTDRIREASSRRSAPVPRVCGSPLTGGNTPKPEIVRRILDRHGIDPADAVMIGDRRHDVEGARANGLRAIAVTWGYAGRTEIDAARPDFVVGHPEEIAAVVAGGGPARERGDADAQPQEIITNDNLNARVDAQVYFKVKPDETSVKAPQYNVDDYRWQIINLARTTLRNIIGTLTLKTANSERDRINRDLLTTLSKETRNRGMEIVRTERKEIDPPKGVQQTMNKVVKAENEKIAALDFANAQERQADGAKRAEIKKAEGVKQGQIPRAEGEAEAIRLVNEAANRYFIGNAQLLRKLEAVERALSDNAKIVIPTGTELVNVIGEMAGVLPLRRTGGPSGSKPPRDAADPVGA